MARWFRNRLREARGLAGLTLEELGEKLGVTGAAVCNWENGASEPREATRDKADRFIAKIEARASRSMASKRPGAKTTADQFSEWLQERRLAKGLSRAALAEAAGVSAQSIYLIESGKIESPRQQTIQAIRKALDEENDPLPEEQESIDSGVGEFRGFNPHADDELPEVPGVYVFYDVSDRPIYVGKASNIRTRTKNHRDKFWFKYPIVQTAAYVRVDDDQLRHQIETLLIKFLKSNAIVNQQNVYKEED
jgi:transcriptional regulator with XRE-family HTH domain